MVKRMIATIEIDCRNQEAYDTLADQVSDEIRNCLDLIAESAREAEEGEQTMVEQIGDFALVATFADEEE